MKTTIREYECQGCEGVTGYCYFKIEWDQPFDPEPGVPTRCPLSENTLPIWLLTKEYDQ
jgi:hypothetical protein